MSFGHFCKGCSYGKEWTRTTEWSVITEEKLFDLKSDDEFLPSLLSYCPRADKRFVKKVIRSKKVHLQKGFGHKIRYCRRCNTLSNPFNFALVDQQGRVIYKQKDVHCKQCGERTIIIKDDFDPGEYGTPTRCPKCNGELELGWVICRYGTAED